MPYCNKSDSLKQYRAFWLYVNITQDVNKLFAPTEKIVAKHVRKPLELFSPLTYTVYTNTLKALRSPATKKLCLTLFKPRIF